MWLIRFKYEYADEFFQLISMKTEYQLVVAETFKEACELIKLKYTMKCWDFENLTI